MAAVTIVRLDHGPTPTVVSAESGIGFARADGVAPATPVPKPVATGTAFSWPKWLHLEVTSGGGTTSISARTIKMSTTTATGIEMFYKDAGATYTQASTNAAADSGTQGADPAGYTPLTTSPQTWDASTVAATNATRNGNFVNVAIGLSDNFAGGAGTATLPSLLIGYTEA
jgi:hypothetical protein